MTLELSLQDSVGDKNEDGTSDVMNYKYSDVGALGCFRAAVLAGSEVDREVEVCTLLLSL